MNIVIESALQKVVPLENPEFGDIDFKEHKWFLPSWFALYTRSRHEKYVHQELRRKDIESFLPLRKIKKQWSDRKIIVDEPLFKGYLFVNMSLLHRSNVINTKGVVRLVGSPLEPAIIPEQEILAVKRFIEEEMKIDPFPYLKAGSRVRVRSGPFKGIEGFIVRKGKQCRLVISMDLIMQSVSIEIDADSVELLF